jgi:hypothetical protein
MSEGNTGDYANRNDAPNGRDIHGTTNKRPFEEAFPTAEYGSYTEATNNDTELAQLHGEGEAVWHDIFCSDAISLDEASMALLSESLGHMP